MGFTLLDFVDNSHLRVPKKDVGLLYCCHIGLLQYYSIKFGPAAAISTTHLYLIIQLFLLANNSSLGPHK